VIYDRDLLTCTKVQGSVSSVGSEDRVETNGWMDRRTDRRMEAVALPPSLMRSVMMLGVCLTADHVYVTRCCLCVQSKLNVLTFHTRDVCRLLCLSYVNSNNGVFCLYIDSCMMFHCLGK